MSRRINEQSISIPPPPPPQCNCIKMDSGEYKTPYNKLVSGHGDRIVEEWIYF